LSFSFSRLPAQSLPAVTGSGKEDTQVSWLSRHYDTKRAHSMLLHDGIYIARSEQPGYLLYVVGVVHRFLA
jgi:hypothetical protein